MIFEFTSEIVWSDRSNKRPKNQTGNIRTGSEQMRNMLSAAAPSLEDLKLSLTLCLTQRRCHPQEALYFPTFSHLFDCQ